MLTTNKTASFCENFTTHTSTAGPSGSGRQVFNKKCVGGCVGVQVGRCTGRSVGRSVVRQARTDDWPVAMLSSSFTTRALQRRSLASLRSLPTQFKRISVNVWKRALESEPETKWRLLIGRDGGRTEILLGRTGLNHLPSLARLAVHLHDQLHKPYLLIEAFVRPFVRSFSECGLITFVARRRRATLAFSRNDQSCRRIEKQK